MYIRDRKPNSGEGIDQLRIYHLSALKLLPADKIPGAFNELKPHLPEEASEVIGWLENNYVPGRIRRQLCNGLPIQSPYCLLQICGLYIREYKIHTKNIKVWHRRWEI